MAAQTQHDMLSKDKLETISRTLEGLAGKKELRPRSAYLCFTKEKCGKDVKGRISIKEAGTLWKTMSAKQKEPYVKMHNDAVAKADAVKKEFSQTFDKHWAALEKHLDAEAKMKEERVKRNTAEKKAKDRLAKKTRLERKKHMRAQKMRAGVRRAPTRAAPRATSAPRSSAARIAELSRGLDTSIWEVRESTTRPGFFYYLNKRTRESTADRPRVSAKRPAPPEGKGVVGRPRMR